MSDSEAKTDQQPTQLGDLLAAALRHLAPSVRASREEDGMEEAREAWHVVVGEDLAELTEVLRFRSGVLTVAVSSAPLRAELSTFARADLVRGLEEQGLRGIHDVKFKTAELDSTR